MGRALEHLEALPEGVVLCFPQHWYDLVAYKTKKKVVYGGHGFGFKLLEPIFPRILKPILEIIKGYKVQYLLTHEGYLPDIFIRELSEHNMTTFGRYHLYTLKANLD